MKKNLAVLDPQALAQELIGKKVSCDIYVWIPDDTSETEKKYCQKILYLPAGKIVKCKIVHNGLGLLIQQDQGGGFSLMLSHVFWLWKKGGTLSSLAKYGITLFGFAGPSLSWTQEVGEFSESSIRFQGKTISNTSRVFFTVY